MLFGVSLFSPRLVRPLASLTGRPLERLRGLTGRLARENAMRKPGRTATTAAALMIGLALVVFVTIFAAGLKTSVAKTIDESFRGEIVLQNSDGFSPIPREAVRRAGEVDGVETVSSITYATGALPNGGENVRVAAVDPATLGTVLALTFKSGDPSVLAGLGPHDAIVDDNFARDKGLEGGRHAAPAHAARANGHVQGARHRRGRARPAREGDRGRERHAAVRPAPAELRAGAARAGRLAEAGAGRDGRRAEGRASRPWRSRTRAS